MTTIERCARDDNRLMPIQGTAGVVAYFPWSLFTDEDEKWSQENHDQTLSRIAERNGFGICELVAVLEHRRWRSMPFREAWAALWKIAFERHRRAVLQAMREPTESMYDAAMEAMGAHWCGRALFKRAHYAAIDAALSEK